MERSKRPLSMVVILFVIGAISLSRFSHNVRSVDVVGLSGAGFAFGVGFAFLLLGLRGKIKP
jgi:hypothetical protein